MQTLSRDEVRKRLDQNDQALIEVLPEENYKKFHLPGAVTVPIGEDFPQQIREVVPDKSKPIVVYCMDAECQASSKAARILEDLGYQEIYDYEPGKVDWKEAGLPIEQ